jgi:hypothetical protein
MSLSHIDKLAIAALQRGEGRTAIQRSQDAARVIFESTPFQMSSAILIFFNFIISVVDAQLTEQA